MGDSNDMILVCDGPYKHCHTGRWAMGHVCRMYTEGHSEECRGTIGRVRWTAVLKAAAKLGGEAAVEALLNEPRT